MDETLFDVSRFRHNYVWIHDGEVVTTTGRSAENGLNGKIEVQQQAAVTPLVLNGTRAIHKRSSYCDNYDHQKWKIS